MILVQMPEKIRVPLQCDKGSQDIKDFTILISIDIIDNDTKIVRWTILKGTNDTTNAYITFSNNASHAEFRPFDLVSILDNLRRLVPQLNYHQHIAYYEQDQAGEWFEDIGSEFLLNIESDHIHVNDKEFKIAEFILELS